MKSDLFLILFAPLATVIGGWLTMAGAACAALIDFDAYRGSRLTAIVIALCGLLLFTAGVSAAAATLA